MQQEVRDLSGIATFTTGDMYVEGARLVGNLVWPAKAPSRARLSWFGGTPLTAERAPSRPLAAPVTAPGQAVILVVDPQARQRELAGTSGRGDARIQRVASLAQVREIMAEGRDPVTLVVIDIDSCGGIATVISELLVFRVTYIGTPVVLVSAESETDDYDTVRLALCDATLRGTVSMARLDAGLAEVRVNNRIWQTRNARN